MKQHKRLATTLLGLATAGGAALAGEEPVAEPPPTTPVAACNWCDLIKAPGKPLYENDDNAFIQSFSFFGRAQLQTAHISGDDVNGDSFDESFEEVRRLRFGAEVDFLRFFKVKANANFENDTTPSGGDRDIGYDSLDAAILSFNAAKAFGGAVAGLDTLKLNYGRHKVKMGQEVHTSSKYIKTPERSAPANKIYPERMTGATVNLGKGNVSGILGVFSTEADPEIAGWHEGTAWYASGTLKRDNGDKIIADFLYNDANGTSENQVGDNVGMDLYEWALSLAYVMEREDWEVLINLMIGDNGDNANPYREGMFYGLVVMPSYWLIAEKLEAVARYTLQLSEEHEGIRSNSRYLRRDHGGDVNSGRGDEHHSAYLGLNYYFCEHHSKLMGGVEYDSLETTDGNVDAWTLWLAYRMYF